MVRPSRHKRRQDDDKPDGSQPPSKRRRVPGPTKEDPPRESASLWTYPPEFYDSLPFVRLTRRALDEFNRRTWLADRRSSKNKATFARSGQPPAKSLAVFSRHGGPDLTDLRGHTPPKMPRRKKVTFSPGKGPPPRPPTPGSAGSASVPASSTSGSSAAQPGAKSRKSSAYDANFELHLTVFHVFNPGQSTRPSDLAEITAAIRAVPSKDNVTEDDFAALQTAFDNIQDEDDVVANILPLITGPNDWIENAPARNVLFNNIAPLTNNSIVPLKPDMYYGSPPQELAPDVRAALGSHIMPTTAALHRPLLPNFFVEVKGPYGTDAVALRQVRYDGAVGARAMHSLENYAAVRDGVPASLHTYSGHTHTLSATITGDMLRLFGHHVTAPEPRGSLPAYHMSRLGVWALSGSFEQFRDGVAAFRNARDMARRFRGELIAEANIAASAAVTTDDAAKGKGAEQTTNVVDGPAPVEPPSELPAEPTEPTTWPQLKRPRDVAESDNTKTPSSGSRKSRRRTDKAHAAAKADDA